MTDPDVKCRRYDCHSNSKGCCVCLTDNNFGKKPCPFYKEASAWVNEQHRCFAQLMEQKKAGLIEHYDQDRFASFYREHPDLRPGGVPVRPRGNIRIGAV